MMGQRITSLLLATALSCWCVKAYAAEIKTNMARMQAMDKITGKVSEIDVPVGGEVLFGSFSIVVRTCLTRSPEETPENFAFVDVVDNYKSEEPINIFKGWMMSSTPALNAVEHPIYDVWLLKCYDGNIKGKKLLSEEDLNIRDELPSTQVIEDVNTEENKEQISDNETAETLQSETEGKASANEPDAEVVSVVVNEDTKDAEHIAENEDNQLKSLAEQVISTEQATNDEVEVINQEDNGPQMLLNIEEAEENGFELEDEISDEITSDNQGNLSVVE